MRGGDADMVMVGDRGMISQKAIDEMQASDGIGWITALKSASVRTPIEQGQLQLGLFDEHNLHQYKVAKHFELAIGETTFSFGRKPDSIAAEAALDGLYIIRTSVPAPTNAYLRVAAFDRSGAGRICHCQRCHRNPHRLAPHERDGVAAAVRRLSVLIDVSEQIILFFF